MTWDSLTSILLNNQWQFTQPLPPSIELFRVRNQLSQEMPFYFYAYLSQAIIRPDGKVEFFGFKRFYASNLDEFHILELKINPELGDRRIAFRWNPRYRTPITWLISVDYFI